MRRLLPFLLLAGCSREVACPAGQINVGAIVGGLVIAPVSQVHPGAPDPVTQEIPLAGADVYLADAGGKALPGLHYAADANGRFDIRRAPPDAAVQVVAQQGGITERSLANGNTLGSNVQVNVGSTVLTRALLDGRTGRLGGFSPATYNKAVDLVYSHLRQEPTYNPAGGLERFNSWLQADTELKQAYDELRGALGATSGTYADLIKEMYLLNGQVPPSSAPTGSASPSVAPSATPSANPSATPTPEGTPVAAQPGVVTLVGFNGSGYVDGPVASAKLAGVEAIAVDPAGNLWVGETANHRIRKITPDGQVSTVAGTGVAGFNDGPGDQAQFGRISGMAIDASGTLYVADMANRRIRKLDTLDPTHTVSTLAQDLENPACVAPDELSSAIYVTEFSGLDVQTVQPNGTAARLATGFTEPWGIAMVSGSLFVVDAGSNVVKKVDLDGTVSTFATGFARPKGLASDNTGRFYVADQDHHQVIRVGADGATEVYAGTGNAGDADNADREAAGFRSPTAIAVGPDGAVYVVDNIVDRIRVIR